MWDYKGLIGGTDPVAVETICLNILLQKRQALRGEPWPLSPPPLCVEMADTRYALGTSRLEEIRLERLGWSTDSLV
jgi:Fe2+ transport system protein FeoA